MENINIVQTMLVHREGDLLDESIPSNIKFCNKVLILLDNFDEYTEKKVLFYKEKYPNKIVVKYSNIESLEGEMDVLNKRFKKIQGFLRDSLLAMARREDEKEKIDILTMFDADEVIRSNIREKIDFLLKSDFSSLMYSRCIDAVGDYYHFTVRNIHSHCRIFKYNRALTSLPERGRLILRPLFKKDLFKCKYLFIHLPYFNLKKIYERSTYKTKDRAGKNLWKTEKDIRSLSDKEITRTIRREPLCLLSEYIKKNI